MKKAPGKPADKKSLKKEVRRILIAGISILAAGFIVLSMVDRTASNWAGFAAPLLIFSGWIVIGVGLWKGE